MIQLKINLIIIATLLITCGIASGGCDNIIKANVPNQTTQTAQVTQPVKQCIATECFEYINNYRVENGLQPLVIDQTLVTLAKEHCEYMLSIKDINHDNAEDRFNRSPYLSYGENVASGYSNGKALAQGWIDSPEHRENILNGDFTHTGLVVINKYACQIFGGD
jgi:uncharacterized protein YkwD